ncbi:MAG: hypothetical protein GY782_07365 [Gammaproteobacteria bacterium]|nr:hypothetical protein [Gammaproteobacteria bacterium]
MQFERLQSHISRFIYLYAILASLALTFIISSWQQPFNSDGIRYLNAAAAYQQHGFHAALAIYSWPFMSIVIAVLASVSHLSLLHAAYLFNFIADTLTVVAAVALAPVFGFSRGQQLLLLLLLLIFPWFNHFRTHIMRGHGYYAASLLAMLLLIYHAKQPRLLVALGFSIIAMVATLFRIEGAIILLVVPLVLLCNRDHSIGQRCWASFSCYLLPGLAVILLMVILWHQGHLSLQRIGQIKMDILQPLHQPLHAFLHARDKIAANILPFHSKHDSVWLLSGGLIAMLLQGIISALGGFYCILALYTLCQRPLLQERQASRVVMAYLLINLLIGAAFLLENFFLSRRYIALFVLIMVLILPRGISQLYHYYCRDKRWWQRAILLLLLLGLLANAVATIWHFGPSKRYVIDAGAWMAQQLPADKKVYIADPQLAYYAGRSTSIGAMPGITVTQLQTLAKVQHYDYIAIKFTRDRHYLLTKWVKQLGQPLMIFGQKYNGTIVIFAHHNHQTVTKHQ